MGETEVSVLIASLTAWALGAWEVAGFAARLGVLWAVFCVLARLWFRVLVRSGAVRALDWRGGRGAPPTFLAVNSISLHPGEFFRVRARHLRGDHLHDVSPPPIRPGRALLARLRSGIYMLPRAHNAGGQEPRVVERKADEVGTWVLIDVPEGTACHVRSNLVEGHSESVGGFGITRLWTRPMAWVLGLTGMLRVEGPAQVMMKARHGVAARRSGESTDPQRVFAILGDASARPAPPQSSEDGAGIPNFLWGELQFKVAAGVILVETVSRGADGPRPVRALLRFLWKIFFPIP